MQPRNDKIYLGEEVATNFRNTREQIRVNGEEQARDELTVTSEPRALEQVE